MNTKVEGAMRPRMLSEVEELDLRMMVESGEPMSIRRVLDRLGMKFFRPPHLSPSPQSGQATDPWAITEKDVRHVSIEAAEDGRTSREWLDAEEIADALRVRIEPRIRELEAENAKLREALTAIVNELNHTGDLSPETFRIACAALGGSDE